MTPDIPADLTPAEATLARQDRDRATAAREHDEALIRLSQNPDFEKVFARGYFQDRIKDTLQTLRTCEDVDLPKARQSWRDAEAAADFIDSQLTLLRNRGTLTTDP